MDDGDEIQNSVDCPVVHYSEGGDGPMEIVE